jgi:glycosyltransferase involved in cell wall biosynthesis
MNTALRTTPVAADRANKPMRLLAYVHLRNIYGSTGAGRVARQMTEHLSRQAGMSLKILADPADHARIVPKVGEPWSSFDYRFIANETSFQQLRWLLLGNPKCESYWPEADVVYCTGESFVPARKSRVAVTLHDAAYFEKDAHCRDLAYYKTRTKWGLLYRVLSRKADMFHVVSHFSAERLAHFFPAIAGRIRVVHNAVTDNFTKPVTPEGSQYLEQMKLDRVPFVLLPRGLSYRKNADMVIENWPKLQERHRDLKLVITSHCDQPYKERAMQLPSAILTGFVSDDALCALYSAAQAVWFPSLYEGFGLPVIEAMACGAPVVASNASSIPEIAANDAILVEPRKAADYIEALDALIRNAALRTEYSNRGKLRARLFTWPAAADQLRCHLSQLL